MMFTFEGGGWTVIAGVDEKIPGVKALGDVRGVVGTLLGDASAFKGEVGHLGIGGRFVGCGGPIGDVPEGGGVGVAL